ncbi:MAG: AraC family transcriptional regulator [Muribaculaceae bacterium]|nr:AraC family transcriptional regulator [Muribaculaceae bacterium]
MDYLHGSFSAKQLLSLPCTVIALAMQGWADLDVNLERVRVEPGVCLCYSELSPLCVVSSSSDFRVRLLLLDREFAFTCSDGIETALPQALHDCPLLHVADMQLLAALQAMFDALKALSLNTMVTVSTQVSGGVVRSLMLLLGDLSIRNRSSSARRTPYTMADTYFRRFVRLLDDNIALRHEVAFYAEQIHISSKYLNQICQRKTGRKAKELISQLLLRNIKRELLVSGKSMKGIAAEYGFADQSSMGKFFRKLTGLSPLHYKQWKSQNNG